MTYKKIGKYGPYRAGEGGRKKSIECASEEPQILDLLEKNLKETMFKGLKECMMAMSHRIESINKEKLQQKRTK